MMMMPGKYTLPRNPKKLWEFFTILKFGFWKKLRMTIKYTFIKLIFEVRETEEDKRK